MDVSKLDTRNFEVLNLPYNRVASELSPVQRIIRGQNTFITLGGKLSKRPGTIQLPNSNLNVEGDRIVIYETLDNPPVVYLLGSFLANPGLWAMYYLRLDDVNPQWTQFPGGVGYRAINSSVYPHEIVVHRGLAYIKGFPSPNIRLNCGGPQYNYTNTAGTYSADFLPNMFSSNYYTSGNTPADSSTNLTTTTAIDTSLNPADLNGNQYIMQSARVAPTSGPSANQMSFTIPITQNIGYSGLTSLLYNINLFFAEIGGAALGARKFNVLINGSTVATALDIRSSAGALNKAIVLQFSGTISTSSIKIDLINNGGTLPPLINAIEIYPPATQTDTLGTVIFDGTGATPSVKPWGLLGPQTPATLSSPAGWPASSHSVTVNYNWGYVYAYQSITGHVSNRSPIQSDPTLNPSYSGAFTNKIPQVTVQGTSDTTNIPYINIYRTTDGGGTFFFLQQIANTGAGSILYQDNSLVAGGTRNDPIPDNVLDITKQAPTLTSNSPPPAVLPPYITGLDSPIRSTKIVSYAGRLWYAIGNYLWYSALEEVNTGVPEECFPSGQFGNFFRLPYAVNQLEPTPNALTVLTTQATYYVAGQSKDSFIPITLFPDVGALTNHPRASSTFNNSIAWLTQDYRIAVLTNGQLSVISDPLLDDLETLVNAGGEIGINHWAELDKDYLIVNSFNRADTTQSRQYIYDIKKSQIMNDDFWFTPWTVRATACASGRIQATSTRRLVWLVWDGTNSQLVYFDPLEKTGTDSLFSGTTNYGFTCDLHLMTIPPGNHLNILSAPPRAPIFEFIILYRTRFAGDNDPDIACFVDDTWTTPIALQALPDTYARLGETKGYKTSLYNIHRSGQRLGLRIAKTASNELFQLQQLVAAFDPVSGT